MSHGGAPRGRSVNPDVVRAIAGLRAGDVLSAGQAAFFDRVARRGVVSVRFEIRALLYAGVLLLTAGVGVLVARHQDEIGPLAIATGIALAAAGSLIWVTRRAAPFSWGEAPSPSLAFDYVLLLGLLLVAADLAYVEMQFTVLGAHWAYHLLIVGVLYLLAAALSAWLARKAHFEEVFANAGLLLLLGGLLSGVLDDREAWSVWLVAVLLTAGGVMAVALRLGRSLYFAVGLVAAYIALVRLLFEPFRYGQHADSIPLLLAALLGSAVLALIF